jgi:hypothetical protein
VERRGLVGGSAVVVAAMVLLFVGAVSVYGTDAQTTRPTRHVNGNTIVSGESPKAELSIAKEFRFAGTQTVNLYGNADAEQFLFTTPGPGNTVGRFYWLQFEHFLPTNDMKYNYDSTRTAQLGDLSFVYDVKGFSDFAALLTSDPASDGAAMQRLLAKQNLSFPHKTVMVRMFHLPTADHRTELMVIYGEALPQDTTVPARADGAKLDTESPDSAKTFLEHARQGLVIRTR